MAGGNQVGACFEALYQVASSPKRCAGSYSVCS